MYGLWYVTFSVLAVMGLCLLAVVLFRKAENKAYEKYLMAYEKYWEENRSAQNEIEKIKASNKHDSLGCWRFWFAVVSAVLGFAAFVLLLVSILNPVSAKRDFMEFKEIKVVCEYTLKDGSDYENIAITKNIIEKNEWLAKAKADLKRLGCFSRFYGLDLESVTPISLKKGV